MYMDTRMDTGDIIAKEEIKIGKDDTADQVHDKLALLGGKVLKEVISLLSRANLKVYCKMMSLQPIVARSTNPCVS